MSILLSSTNNLKQSKLNSKCQIILEIIFEKYYVNDTNRDVVLLDFFVSRLKSVESCKC